MRNPISRIFGLSVARVPLAIVCVTRAREDLGSFAYTGRLPVEGGRMVKATATTASGIRVNHDDDVDDGGTRMASPSFLDSAKLTLDRSRYPLPFG